MANPNTRYNLGLFNSGTYSPAVVNITAISRGLTTTVTTAIAHTFVVGQEVQFFIPPQNGIQQLNGLTGYVSSIPTTVSFVVNINSTSFDPFASFSPTPPTVVDPPQVAGIGDSNTGTLSPGGVTALPNTVPGAYENQPP